MVITWDEDATPHPVGDVAELHTYLDRLHAQAEAEGYPRLADIEAPDGTVLGITVGADQSTVVWDDGANPAVLSRNHVHGREPMVQVTGYNQPTWFPSHTLIPATLAREFLTTGGHRPTGPDWGNDW